jgi:hypothetical protein
VLADVQRDPVLQLAVLGAGVALVAGWLVVPKFVALALSLRRRDREDDGGLSASTARDRVAAANPDWDPDRIDRVVDGFLTRTGRGEPPRTPGRKD